MSAFFVTLFKRLQIGVSKLISYCSLLIIYFILDHIALILDLAVKIKMSLSLLKPLYIHFYVLNIGKPKIHCEFQALAIEIFLLVSCDI